MKFLLVVNAAPTHQAAYTAYRFCDAALTKNHQILRIFFYLDGVYTGSVLNSPPTEEFNLLTAWQDLVQRYSLDLVMCVAASSRRGIIHLSNCAPEFKIAGLGQLIDACISADRVLTFNP